MFILDGCSDTINRDEMNIHVKYGKYWIIRCNVGNFGIFLGIVRIWACKTDYTIHDKTICIIFWNCYLSFRQVNKTIRDNSLMQMKRVTTMKGILIWNCNSIRYLIQTMGSRTKFFLEILATLASWCKNLKISYSSFCMQLHLLF